MSTEKLKHRSDLKGEIYEGREIIHAIEFKPGGTFYALSAATVYLKDLKYNVGTICSNYPIGFAYGYEYINKWPYLDPHIKEKLDGIIIPQPEFREGGALIIFFTPPRY